MTKDKRGVRSGRDDDRPQSMTPYADDEAVLRVGGFSVENGTACVSLSGSLDLTKDKEGLQKARELKRMLEAVVSALEGVPDLPDEATADATPAKTVKNPFA